MNTLRFQPIYQTRVWGGRELERLFARELPADGQPYGESWEIVDRLEAQSIVSGGELVGWTLQDLWSQRREEIFGKSAPDSQRFPLLVKILDAREDLSLQVHPPAHLAAELNGEPKTEMWVVAEALPGATLAVGVRRGVTRESFAQALSEGTVGDLVPHLPVTAGDAIFIPSGRLHAIGAGLVIFEIQQNSDTTYRVFDWNRVGLDGQPRTLHVAESLRCIDFADNAPTLCDPDASTLVKCDFFKTIRLLLPAADSKAIGTEGAFALLIVMQGTGVIGGETVNAGDHLIIPAASETVQRTLLAQSEMTVLVVRFS